VSFGFCAVGFRGACRLQKNAPRGLGQGIAPRKRAKHTMLPQALRLDRPEGDAQLRKCSKEAFSVGFLFRAWGKILYCSCSSPRLMPGIAFMLCHFKFKQKHEGYTWLRHS